MFHRISKRMRCSHAPGLQIYARITMVTAATFPPVPNCALWQAGQHLAYHKCVSVSVTTPIGLTAEQRRAGQVFLSALPLINHRRPKRLVCVRVSARPSFRPLVGEVGSRRFLPQQHCTAHPFCSCRRPRSQSSLPRVKFGRGSSL